MLRIRLQTQLLIYLFSCITLLFLIQFLVVRVQIGELQTAQSETLNLELVQSKAGEIGGWFNQRLCEIRIATQHDGFASMDKEKILPYLETLNACVSSAYGDLAQPFVISDTEGTAFLQDGETLDISQREYFQQAFASQKEYTVSKPLYSRLAAQRVVIVSYAIRDASGKKTGYIHGSLALGKIDEVLSGITLYDGAVWIMDSEGRILAESENHIHGEEQDACPKSYNFSTVEGQLWQEAAGICTLPLHSGGEGVLFSADIPNAQGWKLCALVSRAAMEAPMRTMNRFLVAVWAILAGAAALLSYWYARFVMDPINKLAAAMDALDPDGTEPQYPVARSLELSRLVKSFRRMTARIRALRTQVVQEQEHKRDAERRLLQAQLNPHFLYNTLDTISWKALEHDAQDVSDLICALAQFFRLSLGSGQEFVPLQKELEHIESYLYIQKVRYEDKLTYRLELDERAKRCLVPVLLLQPLVENAIYHGLKPKEGKGALIVRARLHGADGVSILVADDGVGMERGQLEQICTALLSGGGEKGFGLCSILKRLRTTYGVRCAVSIKSRSGRGTVIRLLLPREEEHDI